MSEPKLDEFHYHEAMDRAWLLMEVLENALSEHPAIVANPKLRDLVSETHDRLYDIYQYAAALRFPEKDDQPSAASSQSSEDK